MNITIATPEKWDETERRTVDPKALDEIYSGLLRSNYGSWAFIRVAEVLDLYKPTPVVVSLLSRGFFYPGIWHEELAKIQSDIDEEGVCHK